MTSTSPTNTNDIYTMSSLELRMPTFGGSIGEDSLTWIHKFLAYLRATNIPEQDDARRRDILLMALDSGSPAERFFLLEPVEYKQTFGHCLQLIQTKFGSPNRIEATKQAALNALHVRAFRDEKHRGESVQDLIKEFERYLPLARIDDDREKREQFLWTFRKFPAATRMLNRSVTLDGAIVEALRWEKMLIERSGIGTPTSI